MALHDTDLQGRKVRVGWAQRNTALFVGKKVKLCLKGSMSLSSWESG